MRLFIQAATLLAASASVWAIPTKNPSSPSTDDRAVADSIDFNGPSVLFSIPCPGCFSDPSEELDIELKIESSVLACQTGLIVVNDVRLSSTPSSNESNPIRFKANTINRPSTQDVVAHWSMSCLNDEVTLLSVAIDEVLGHTQVPPGSYFSASFRQKASPEVLRVERALVGDVSDSTTMQHWTRPQEDPEYTLLFAPVAIDEALPDKFKEELRRLHEIKAHIGRLHHQYMVQERHVFEMIKQDFNACHGASCLFQTAIKKAPDFFELVKAHFKHRPDWDKIHKHGFPPVDGIRMQGDHSIMYDGPDDIDGEPSFVSESMPDHTPLPNPFDGLEPEDLPSFHTHPPPPFPGDDHDMPPPPWSHHGPPPPWRPDGHRPPPPPPPPPPQPPHHKHPAQNHTGRPPWAGHRGPGHHGPAGHKPHFVHRHGPHRHPFFFSVGSMIFFVVAASLLFRCVRAKTGLFANHQRKRDRAARREERRSRAAYRRAAIQHRWGQWWSQFRRPQSTADYEEKRARILGQEDALEDAMQSEIQDLRRAHEIVGDMMRAEEGRHRLYHEANFGSASQSQPASYGLQSQLTDDSRTTELTLPLYHPPPPSYDQELEGDMMVVDGFTYTPSGTDGTPGSSVIDCNSRMSFETDNTITQ